MSLAETTQASHFQWPESLATRQRLSVALSSGP